LIFILIQEFALRAPKPSLPVVLSSFQAFRFATAGTVIGMCLVFIIQQLITASKVAL
jgi:hypothetical protein